MKILKTNVAMACILLIFITHIGISIWDNGFVFTSGFGTESVMSIVILICYMIIKSYSREIKG